MLFYDSNSNNQVLCLEYSMHSAKKPMRIISVVVKNDENNLFSFDIDD